MEPSGGGGERLAHKAWGRSDAQSDATVGLLDGSIQKPALDQPSGPNGGANFGANELGVPHPPRTGITHIVGDLVGDSAAALDAFDEESPNFGSVNWRQQHHFVSCTATEMPCVCTSIFLTLYGSH